MEDETEVDEESLKELPNNTFVASVCSCKWNR
jgi:hypothetical protein